MNKTTQEHLLDEGDSGGAGECKWNCFFEEKNNEQTLVAFLASQEVTTMKYAEKPPPPRNETNLSGLKNQGATW